MRYRQASAATADELVNNNRWIVPYVVGRLRIALPPDVSREELIAAGSLGLVQASHGFDPRRGCEFSTFAFERVRGAILDSLRQADPMSRDARRNYKKLQAFEDEYRRGHGVDPSDDQVQEATGLGAGKADELRQRAQAVRVLSLEDPSRQGQGDPLRMILAGPSPDPVTRAELRERLESLTKALTTLPERERQVVQLYYFGGHLLKEIATALGVSAARVSQLHARALERLRSALRGAYGQDKPKRGAA
jgi:RNA polymerase sigma factor for flagellar operon FliA